MSRIARNSLDGGPNRNTFCSGTEVAPLQCSRGLICNCYHEVGNMYLHIILISPCPETRAIASVRVHTCRIPIMSEKSPVPTSLSTVQSHMPNRNFFVPTATLVTVMFSFHGSGLSCFILMRHLARFSNKKLSILDTQILDRTCYSK